MNTYIQNKLDKFRKLTIQLRKKHFTIDTGGDGIVEVLPNLEEQARYNNGIEKFIEQALTDYHNHIVEKVKERFESGEYEMEDGFSYENGIDLSEIPNELFIEFKGIKKGMLGITNYIKKDLIKLLNNI